MTGKGIRTGSAAAWNRCAPMGCCRRTLWRVPDHRRALSGARCFLALPELIVALVLLGLAAAMLAPALVNLTRRTAEPALQSRQAAALVQVAERIGNDYERNLNTRSNLAAFRERIVNRTGNYGQYDSATGEFVRLDSGGEVAGGATDVLKVTIRNGGAVLTLLFPHREQ